MAPKQTQAQLVEKWILDPLAWAESVLSAPDKPYRPSTQQKEGWEAYRRLLTAKLKRAHGVAMTAQEQDDAKKIGLSIMSGHGTGKDAFAAAVGLHFQMMQREPKVIVTAPAGPQLFTVIWPEFGKWINRSPTLKLVYEKDSNKVYLKDRGGNEYFIKPRTIQANSSPEEQSEVLAGTHSYSVLYICDEASGILDPVFKPIEGGLTDPVAIVLMIFNPTQRHGFAIDSHTKNRQDWLCLHWDAEALKEEKLADPQTFFWFDEQAQERLARKYGRESDFYRVRVRGFPPAAPPGVLIPWDWAMRAVNRGKIEGLEPHEKDPLVFGLDVGGGGEDPSVLVVCRGPFVLGIHELNEFDSVKIGYWAQGLISDYRSEAPVETQFAIGVDTGGIGVGVYSYFHTVARLDNCYSINAQEETSHQDKFFRLRDEIWWNAREAFEKDLVVFQLSASGQITPELDGLIAELTTIKYDDEKGKVKVEGKKEMKKRGLASPNKADAFNICQHLLTRYVSRVPRSMQRGARRRSVVSNWKVV
jgi:hypothetical protein